MKCLGVLLCTRCSTCSVTSLLCWFGSTRSVPAGFCFLVFNGDSFSVLPYGMKYEWINTLTHTCRQTSVSTCWGGSRSCRSRSRSSVSARLLLSGAKTWKPSELQEDTHEGVQNVCYSVILAGTFLQYTRGRYSHLQTAVLLNSIQVARHTVWIYFSFKPPLQQMLIRYRAPSSVNATPSCTVF